MANKRHKHKVNCKFKGDVPKSDGFMFMQGNSIYHPTLGWRKERKEHHFLTLNTILADYGIRLLNAGYGVKG